MKPDYMPLRNAVWWAGMVSFCVRLCLCPPALAAPPVSTSPDGKHAATVIPASDEGMLQVKDAHGHTVYARHTADPSNVVLRWAADSRALAVFQEGSDRLPSMFIVWRPDRVRTYQGPYCEGEPIFDAVFSADDSRLLIRIPPVMGNYDVNTGLLWGLNLQSGRYRKFGAAVREARWLSATRVRWMDVADNHSGNPDTWPRTPHEADCP